MEKPLHTLGLLETCEGLRDGRFTAETYTRALLARIAARDEAIQAWTWLNPEEAIRAARRCDAAFEAGQTLGPLEGIPVGVKDIFATAGVPTEMGSPAYKGYIPNESAKVIERLEARGGFVLGKTVTTECAFLTPGKTRNPWNPRHTPGGSSSGSAAAVAAGFVPAALGTQTNGSVIRPAAFCGVVGFKPTQGLVPIAGALAFSHTLDQPGLFTRSGRDAAWFAAALGVDGDRPREALRPLPEAPHLAAVRSPVWDLAEDHARQSFVDCLQALRKGGARVEEIELPGPFGEAHQAIRTIMAVESAFNLEALYRDKASLLSAALRDFMTEGVNTGSPVYLRALKTRRELQDELDAFLEGFDAIVTPSTTGEAPATLGQTGNPAFCSIWSLCGGPAVTIPAGLGPRGLPLGLQIVGAQGQDERLLAVALWCEERLPFAPLK